MIESRKILLRLFYAISAVLLIVAVFFLVLWILEVASRPKSIKDAGEYPGSPVSTNVPPAPQVIKITNSYFNGPFFLQDNNDISGGAVFSILCKKDEDYDIIYVGETEMGEQLSSNLEYGCWVDSCEDINNLYVAIFWTPYEKYAAHYRQSLKTLIEQANNPACPIVEE